MSNLMVKKKDGTFEPYSRTKLENGIWIACGKRPVTKEQVDKAINRLEEKWGANKKEVSRLPAGRGARPLARRPAGSGLLGDRSQPSVPGLAPAVLEATKAAWGVPRQSAPGGLGALTAWRSGQTCRVPSGLASQPDGARWTQECA